MNVIVLVFCFIICLSVEATAGKNSKHKLIKKTPGLRSNLRQGKEEIPPQRPLENYPGHSLLQPSLSSLKSSVKFAQDEKRFVYGNLENLGITDGNTQVLYSGFRKGNDIILKAVLKAIKRYNNEKNTKKLPVIIIPSKMANRNKEQKLKTIGIEDLIGLNADGSKNSEIRKKSTSKVRNILDVLEEIGLKAEDSKNRKTSKTRNSKVRNNIVNFKKDQYNPKTSAETLDQKSKRIQDLLNSQVPDKYNARTRAETLDQKTKRIQDLLNSQVPVNPKYPEADTSGEIAEKVVEFLKNLPIDNSKLSLDEKTKYIEDFLNNKMTVFTDGNSLHVNKNNQIGTVHNSINEEENNANEVMDQYSSEDSESDESPDYRRKNKKKNKKKRKFRQRDSKYTSKESVDSDESASSDYERNPGNPFTIHKNKYKQNWLWNHFMDGDHMNINPFGPPFANMGPSGADLFFGRKWWYYNQDDYKPMG